MKILMIGLGSIGQRHLRNIRAHFGDKVEVIAFRVRGLKRTFSDNMQIREGCDLESEFNIKSFTNLDEALSEKPDVAYITNITSQHVPCAIKALEAGCHVFLEKPVSHTLEGVGELCKKAKETGKIVFVGFQNRFHPCVKRLKEVVDSGMLGNIISVQSEIGERLTTMHSYEDYRGTYMARKDQGGGVIMNQQIHELDLIQWLFGIPDSVISYSGKNSSLPIDVEDFSDSIFQINNDGHSFSVYAHADFFQSPPRRFCKLICENGWAMADLSNVKFEYALNDEVFCETFPEFQRNQLYIDEMKEFFDIVNGKKQTMLTLEDGLVSLKLAWAIKKSTQEERKIYIKEVQI